MNAIDSLKVITTTKIDFMDASIQRAITRLEEGQKGLESKLLAHWTQPDDVIPAEFKKSMTFWSQAEKSILARRANVEILEEVAGAPAPTVAKDLSLADSITRWAALLDRTKIRWFAFLEQLDNVSVATFCERFGPIVHSTELSLVNATLLASAVTGAGNLGMDQARSRQRTEEARTAFLQELEVQITTELNHMKLVRTIHSIDETVSHLRSALTAIRDVDLMHSVVKCCEELKVNLPVDAAEQRFVALAAEPRTSTARQLAQAHRAISMQRHHALLAPRNFYPGLANAVGNELMTLFIAFPAAQTLQQLVLDRTNGADTRDLEALNAFEAIHRAFSATEGVQSDFVKLVKSQQSSSQSFFKYMEDVSWCSDVLAANAAVLPRVWELLRDEVDQDNAVSTAMELCLATTTFIITTVHGTQDDHRKTAEGVRLTATTEKRGTDKPLTLSDLEDVCFQLTLAGTTTNADQTDVFASYVTRYQVIKDAAALCADLVAEGHPRFQEQTIKIKMNKTAEEIKNEVCQELKRELHRWVEFKLRAETRSPLLSFLHAHELVVCLKALDHNSRDLGLLAFTIKHAVLPLTPVADVSRAVNTAFVETQSKAQVVNDIPEGQLGAAPLVLSIGEELHVIHRVIELAIGSSIQYIPQVTAELRTVHAKALDTFKELLTKYKICDILCDDLKSDIVVIQIPESDAALGSALSIAIYFAICGRSPLPFELLFCDEDTTHAATFVRRWGIDHAKAIQVPLLFGLNNVQRLGNRQQADLLDSILALRSRRMPMGVVNPADAEEMSSCKSKLFLIVADQGRDSLLSSQLRNTPVIAIPSELVLLGAEVCKHLCASLPILTTSTDAPSSGKTQAVMRLAHDKQLRFASAITDGSAGCFVDQVTTVMRGRVDVDEPILLHISVSHGARGCRINDQLLEYAVLGRLAEHHGKAALRHATDTIVVEIPSQGKLHTTFRAEAPALQWFQHLWVPDRIQLTLFHLSAPPQAELNTRTLHVVEPDFVTNQRLHNAMRILSAYMEASLSRKQRLKHFEDLDDVFCSDDANLAGLILNFCPEKYRNDFGAILRFTRLLTVLLCGIHDFQLYRTASAALEREDVLGGGTMPQHRMHNYRALAYFLVKYSIESATELAATSVPAATDESSDESSRLDGLDLTFDNLRCSFLLFTRDTYEFITTKHDDDDLIATFNKRWNKRNEPDYDWDSDFHAMALDIHHRQDITVTQALRSIHRDGDGFHYKEFQRILPVLGLHANFGLHLINAIEKAELLNIAMETSFSVAVVTCSALISGCHELRRVSKDWVRVLETDTATVGDFFQHTQEWLQSLTSSSKSKSQPFVLTSDSFVRLLAVKTRLLCGIPVVFQGETGQGKTHLLKHMSRVSGTIFEVINIHRGLEASALLTKIQAVEASLRSLMANEANENPIAIVVLDEVNSMRDVWVAKALVCDRVLLGRTIMPEIHFVCIMNPWRRQESQITPGLDFVSANDDSVQTGTGVRQRNLVYDVNRSPESFMSVVWDFGLAHNSVETREYVQNHLWGERASVPAEWNAVTDEHVFAESCFSWHLQKMNSASS
ncbi:Hypothetical protein, putative [Bodo saltans]|uniref:ATPase dynein-related AAA domain-containing protein n=1 Tax=Bodo saltans TaxID=75058 RepID=A0A0S4IL60_BODSA|nr:Hypothetical protein, putative [Bodo saltans]|eukprot:CUE70696.1 Hypothetical protein, putative [Bodo saltans]